MSKRRKGIPQKPYLKEVKPGIFKKVCPKPIPASEFFANSSRLLFSSMVVVNPNAGI